MAYLNFENGKTACNDTNLNKMQDLIKADIDTRTKKVYQKILTEPTYELNIDLVSEGISIEEGDVLEIILVGSVGTSGSDTSNVGLLLLPNGEKDFSVRRASFFEAHDGSSNIQNLENTELALPRIARVYPNYCSICKTTLNVSTYMTTDTDYCSPQGTSASYLGKATSVVGPISNLTSLLIQAISTEMYMTDRSSITIYKK